MNVLKTVFKKIWGFWFYFNLAIWFFVLFPVFALSLSFESLYPLAHQTRRLWGKLLQIFSLQFWSVKYEKKIDFKRQHYILCSNHTSYLDISMMCQSIPGYFNYMGKAELEKIPLFGRFFRTIDIAVDRKSLRSSYRAFQKAKAHISRGGSIVVYPEGTIPDSAPVMKKFKPGAFKMAVDLGVPILPITFLDNWRLLPDDGKYMGRPGLARAIIHAPIQTKGLTEDDLEALSKQVYDAINAPLIAEGIVKEK